MSNTLFGYKVELLITLERRQIALSDFLKLNEQGTPTIDPGAILNAIDEARVGRKPWREVTICDA